MDVPLRVFYPGYFRTLTRLYAALGVESEPVSYASSFTDADGCLYFRYRNWRWGARSWSWLAPQDLLLGAHARDIVRSLLLPAICSVCTCSTALVLAVPAAVIVDDLARGLTRDAVRRAVQGAHDAQARLLQGVPALQVDARIAAVECWPDGVMLCMDDGSHQRFDQVVLATQANPARRLLASATSAEAAVLEGFRYQPVRALTHRDAALMPPRRRNWSPVNLRLAPGHGAPESTIWINAVQRALLALPSRPAWRRPRHNPRDACTTGPG